MEMFLGLVALYVVGKIAWWVFWKVAKVAGLVMFGFMALVILGLILALTGR